MKPRLVGVAALFLLVAAGAAGWWWWFGRTPPVSRAIAYLPQTDGATAYLNVSLLRRFGILDQIAGNPELAEPDYRAFVQATAFDYRKDLDAILLRTSDSTTWFVLTGNFSAKKLAEYARKQGGRCAGDLCSTQGSDRQKQISFVLLEPRLLGLAVGPDPMAAASLSGRAGAQEEEPPSNAPAWVNVPGVALQPREGLPNGVSAFFSALRGADEATLSIRPAGQGVDVDLEAPCNTPEVASTVAGKLTVSTSLVRNLMERGGKTLPPDSPEGVLAAGQFKADQKTVRGKWHLPSSLLGDLSKLN